MIFSINTTRNILKLSQISVAWRFVKLRLTILKYHSWYLCQISLLIMLLPILTSVNLKKADMASRNIVMLGSGLGLNNFVKWKGTFPSDLPKWPDRSKWTTFKSGPEYSGRTKPKWSVPFDVPTKISKILRGQALHLWESREVTRDKHARGDARVSRLAIHWELGATQITSGCTQEPGHVILTERTTCISKEKFDYICQLLGSDLTTQNPRFVPSVVMQR